MNRRRAPSARLALALALILTGPGLSTRVLADGPAIQCDAPVFDYGERPDTVEVDHTFIIRNAGTAPLFISQVRSGCGCTRTMLDVTALPPGGTASLSTRLTLKGCSGPKNAAIYLHSNDPVNPVFVCKYTGTVIPELELAPAGFTFEVTPDSPGQTASVTLTNRTPLPLRPVGMDFPAALSAVSLATNLPGRSYTLTAHCPAGTDSLQAVVTLITDHPRYGRIDIPLTITAIRDLTAFPSALVLTGSTPQATPESARIILLARTNHTFTLRKVEVIPPVIPVSIESVSPARARLKAGPVRVTGAMDGAVIRIHTDLPRQPVVDIPVKVRDPGNE